MAERRSPDHPMVVLLFALEGEPSDQQAQLVQAWCARLEQIRTWTVGPPTLVHEVDGEGVHTLGAFLRVYDGRPPWSERIPLAIDRAQFEDVCALVEAAQTMSRAADEDVVVEYDGETIGWIERGTPTREIEEGLIEGWRRGLDAKTRAVLQTEPP